MITKDSSNIEVKGYIGTWYVIEAQETDDGRKLFLLEHEEFGDTALCLIVDEDCTLLMDDVCNGFDDWDEAQEVSE